MKTYSIPDGNSHPDPGDLLAAYEKAIGGSEGTRARCFFQIRQLKIFNEGPATYSTFEDYAAERWGIRSRSHCDRLCAYGRFLYALDKLAGGSPMGEWSVFLCERAYRELDDLDLEQKEKVGMQIIARTQNPRARAFDFKETRQMAAKLRSGGHAGRDRAVLKSGVTEGRPVEVLNKLPKEDSEGLLEGATLIIRGAKAEDPQALIEGLLRVIEIAPIALKEIFHCKQPNRAIAKAEGYLGRSKRKKAA
jgi:hypothetical protein